MNVNKFKNLKRFGPRISFKINKFLPTSNHSISYLTGDINMVAFASHVQQITLGALYCKLNNFNLFFSVFKINIKSFSKFILPPQLPTIFLPLIKSCGYKLIF